MFGIVIRRSICSILTVTIRQRVLQPSLSVRPLSLSPIHHFLPNMNQMMDELSKNPKAMALFKAIQKNPKILESMQDLMATLVRKGYVDMRNPMKQPSLTMLADSEIRSKLLSLFKLLSEAGIFDAKDNANPSESLSKVMGLLMAPGSQLKNADVTTIKNEKPSQKYDLTYDTKTQQVKVNTDDNDQSTKNWTDKFKKMFK